MADKSEPIDALIKKLDKALQRKRRSFHQTDLQPGLGEKTLAKDKRALPVALRKLWAWRNGQEGFSTGTFGPGGKLLSFEASKKLSGDEPWAPFVQAQGHVIGVDLSDGCVLLRLPKKKEPIALAPSVEAWLRVMLEATEAEIEETEDSERVTAFFRKHVPLFSRPATAPKSKSGPEGKGGPKAVSFDLADAVAKAKPGATITLPTGTITVRKPLVLDKPISLRGAGALATRISGSCPGAIVEVSVKGEGSAALSRLSVTRQGGIGDVIRVSAGHARLEGCDVRGGRERKDEGGDGVTVRGKSVLEANDCRVEDNDAAAVGLIDDSRGTLVSCTLTASHDGIVATNRAGLRAEKCRAFGTKSTGIAFIEGASGEAHDCICSEAVTGILIGGKAKARVSGCESRRNRWHGLCAYQSGEVTVEGSLFELNERHGVLFADDARGEVRGSRARGNAWSGIKLETSAKTAARENRCEENSQHGLVVSGKTAPVVQGNHCARNGIAGINAWGASSAMISKNVCESNWDYGILVGDKAKPRLEENLCRNNDNGISYDQGSPAGVARGNRCLENRDSEIDVLDESTPTIEENTCADGGGDGIVVSGNAKPILRGNQVKGNNASGIEYHRGGGGKASANECTANMEDGIGVYVDTGKVVLEKNVCRDNWGRGIFVDGDVKPSAVVLDGNRCTGNKADFDEAAYLRYLPVGPSGRLMQLMRWWREHRLEACQFTMDAERQDAVKSWLDGDGKKAKHLRVFGACGEGSLLAFWLKDARAERVDEDSTPVVFLGSEGVGSKVVARNFGEFLALLARGAEDLSFELGHAPKKWSSPGDEDEDHRRVARYLRKSLSVAPAAQPEQVVARAMKEVGDLGAWLERR